MHIRPVPYHCAVSLALELGVGAWLNREQKTSDRRKSRTLGHGDGVG